MKQKHDTRAYFGKKFIVFDFLRNLARKPLRKKKQKLGQTVPRSAAENLGRSRSRSRSCGRSAVAAAPQPQVFQIIHKVKENWKNILTEPTKKSYFLTNVGNANHSFNDC